jgi:TorA maturation chaperone TorD
MTDTLHTADFAFSARILGAMFYYPPESEQTQALIAAFRQGNGKPNGRWRRRRGTARAVILR